MVEIQTPTLTDSFLETLSTSSSNKELSRSMIAIYQSQISDRDNRSRDFILRAADPPSINHALMSYFLGACFPTHSLSRNAETLKSTFTIYSLTPPPSSTNKDYQNHLRSTNDNEADFLLDQPETKQAAVQRKCFIGGKQGDLDDVLSTIGNFFEFSKCMVKFDINLSDTYPSLFSVFLNSLSIFMTPNLKPSSLPISHHHHGYHTPSSPTSNSTSRP